MPDSCADRYLINVSTVLNASGPGDQVSIIDGRKPPLDPAKRGRRRTDEGREDGRYWPERRQPVTAGADDYGAAPRTVSFGRPVLASIIGACPAGTGLAIRGAVG